MKTLQEKKNHEYMKNKHSLPSKQQSLLCAVQFHGSRGLKPLPDPVDLVEVVDVHVLGADATAVHVLQPGDDLLQGKGGLFASDEGGLWQLEHCLHVLMKNVNYKMSSPEFNIAPIWTRR